MFPLPCSHFHYIHALFSDLLTLLSLPSITRQIKPQTAPLRRIPQIILIQLRPRYNITMDRAQNRLIMTRHPRQTLRQPQLRTLRRRVDRQTRQCRIPWRGDGLVEFTDRHPAHDVADELAFKDLEVGLREGAGFEGLQGDCGVELAWGCQLWLEGGDGVYTVLAVDVDEDACRKRDDAWGALGELAGAPCGCGCEQEGEGGEESVHDGKEVDRSFFATLAEAVCAGSREGGTYLLYTLFTL